MKSIELYGIGIRLIGIYILFVSVQTAMRHTQNLNVWMTNLEDVKLFILFWVVEVVFIFIAGLIFVKFPLTLAKRLSPTSSSEELSFSNNSKAILEVSICLLGIYILSWAIPDFFDNALFIFFNKDIEFQEQLVRDTYIALYTTVVEIVIGLYLGFWGKGLVRLLRDIRAFGT